MPSPAIYRLGSPRKVPGECNTWIKTWALQIDGTVHQITMKRRLSQKLVVKHDGQVMLNKRFVFAKPSHGYCLVDWISEGISFGVCYQTLLRCIQTNADHYELRVGGLRFSDLPDGCRLRPMQSVAGSRLNRVASLPVMSNTGTTPTHPDTNTNTNTNNRTSDGGGDGSGGRTHQTGSPPRAIAAFSNDSVQQCAAEVASFARALSSSGLYRRS